MALDLFAVADAMATAVKAVPGVRTAAMYDGEAINPPFFVANTDGEFTYDMTFRTTPSVSSLTEMVFNCGIYVSFGAGNGKVLYGFLSPDGPTSIPNAIGLDQTLGGTCKALNVETATGIGRVYTLGGIDYLGAVLQVRVWG
jgi:hypothetical protein